MGFLEITLVCVTFLLAVGMCAAAWYYSKVNAAVQAAIIAQQGIDRRAAARGYDGNGAGAGAAPWYGAVLQAVLPELLKNQAVQDMITKNAPVLIEKFAGAKN